MGTMEKKHIKQVCQYTKSNFTLITNPVAWSLTINVFKMMFVCFGTNWCFFHEQKSFNQVAQFLVNREKAKGNKILPLNTDAVHIGVHFFQSFIFKHFFFTWL